jgi:hypothetical protein
VPPPTSTSTTPPEDAVARGELVSSVGEAVSGEASESGLGRDVTAGTTGADGVTAGREDVNVVSGVGGTLVQATRARQSPATTKKA